MAECPLCGGRRLESMFVAQGTPIVRCPDCSLVMRNPQPSDGELSEIYNEHYFLGSDDDGETSLSDEVDELKRKTAGIYLDEIDAYRRRTPVASRGNRLLEIGCGHGNLLVEAQKRGLDVTGLEYSTSAAATANEKLGGEHVAVGTVEAAVLPKASYDICVLADVIEHTRDPVDFLRHVAALLRPGGVLFVATPSLDSWSARVLGRRWMEYKAEHLFYFGKATLTSALSKTGYEQVWSTSGVKVLSIKYVTMHFRRFPVAGVTPILSGVEKVLPQAVSDRHFQLVASGITMLASRAA